MSEFNRCRECGEVVCEHLKEPFKEHFLSPLDFMATDHKIVLPPGAKTSIEEATVFEGECQLCGKTHECDGGAGSPGLDPDYIAVDEMRDVLEEPPKRDSIFSSTPRKDPLKGISTDYLVMDQVELIDRALILKAYDATEEDVGPGGSVVLPVLAHLETGRMTLREAMEERLTYLNQEVNDLAEERGQFAGSALHLRAVLKDQMKWGHARDCPNAQDPDAPLAAVFSPCPPHCDSLRVALKKEAPSTRRQTPQEALKIAHKMSGEF